MKKKRKFYKIVYISLCISVILLFMRLTPTVVVNKEVQHSQNPYEATNDHRLYNEGMMSPNHLLGLMPKKVNEFIEQHVDEELMVDGVISYCEHLALLDYIKRLQHVLYQMFICLVALICIHTTRKILLRYIYNTDGPKRKFSLKTAI